MDIATTTPARIPALEPPYDPEVERQLTAMMGNRDEPPPLALFRTLMTVPELGARIRPLGSYFLTRGSLAREHRELVIHRVTARLGAEYEWGVHASLFAVPLGMDGAWLEATVHGDAADPAFDDIESVLVAATDELIDHASIEDDTWEALESHFEQEQLLEFLMLVGWYHLIAFVANGARVALEPWAPRFPDGGRPKPVTGGGPLPSGEVPA